MSKFDRIQSPAELNLNTEVSVVIESMRGLETLPKSEYYSIRAMNMKRQEYGSERTPHYPWVEASKVATICRILLETGFYPIVAIGINPHDCEWACVLYKHAGWWVIEAAQGAGTVRRITHDSNIDMRWTADNCATLPAECHTLLSHLRTIPECIVEFSIYKNPVGRLNRHLIVWELVEVGT